jgi:hypothetical protein
MLLRKYQAGISNFNASTGSDRYITQGQSLTCPEGYVYDAVKKMCISIKKSYEIKSGVKEENRDYRQRDLPEYSYSKLVNNKYLKGLPSYTTWVHDPNSFYKDDITGLDDLDDNGNKSNRMVAYFKTYPKPTYNLLIDPSKPEGYFDQKSKTLYTQNKNSIHSKKFNEWNKLIAIQEKNVENAKNKNLRTSEKSEEEKADFNKEWINNKFYNDPFYSTNNQRQHKEYLKEDCVDCEMGHGLEKSTEDDDGNLILNYNTHKGYVNKAGGKNIGEYIITNSTAKPTENAYRRENYITYKPVEGTDYYTMHQDFRKGKEPYQIRENGKWINNPKSKLLYHLDVNGNEIAQPAKEKVLSEDQYKDMLKRGLLKPKVNNSIATNKNGGILLYKN